jgi:hypothetical protein
MIIKPSSALRNDYDGMVALAKEREEVVYFTRHGEGEMVFMTIEQYEKREAELKLAATLLERERSRLAGEAVYSVDEAFDYIDQERAAWREEKKSARVRSKESAPAYA